MLLQLSRNTFQDIMQLQIEYLNSLLKIISISLFEVYLLAVSPDNKSLCKI